jgi:hypothetical protein
LKQPELHECVAPSNPRNFQTDRHQLRQARRLAASAIAATSAWMLAFQRLLFALSVTIMLWLLASLVRVAARASERRDFFAG